MFPWDTLADVTALARRTPTASSTCRSVPRRSRGAGDPRRAGRRQRGARLSDHRGHPRAAGVGRRGAGAPLRHHRTSTDDAVLPVIGTKELIAWLPTLLGLGPDDVVVVPELAYPTYEVGAQLAGAQGGARRLADPARPRSPALVYLNSPSNPTGKVLGVEHLRKVVGWARERGVLVASDECYLGLGWDADAACRCCIPSVCDGDHTGLLAMHSLSKTSSLAGYRAGSSPAIPRGRRAAGGAQARGHDGADAGAGRDGRRARRRRTRGEQRERYARRREALLPALRAAGFDGRPLRGRAVSVGDARRAVPRHRPHGWRERGILVAPGEFYGPRGAQHVRVALTATDERIDAAVERLTA